MATTGDAKDEGSEAEASEIVRFPQAANPQKKALAGSV